MRYKKIWLILKNRDPVKPALDLADIVPKRNRTHVSHLLITMDGRFVRPGHQIVPSARRQAIVRHSLIRN